MTPDDARTTILTTLAAIAPEIDPETIDPDDELGADLDLDTMDFLRLVEGVAAATGRDIPERDYDRISTLATFTAYLSS